MIIVKFKGGLGNQMFQYALYKWFEVKKYNVEADLHFYDEKPEMYRLKDMYGIKLDIAQDKNIRKYSDCSFDFFSRIRRKILGNKKSHIIENTEQFYDFCNINNVYLDGYWQNPRYFEEIKQEIYNIYNVSPRFNQYQKELYRQIKSNNVASIHVRRGDYLKGENVNLYGGICTESYYTKAIQYLITRYQVHTFYVFSDDFEWTNSKFKNTSSASYVIVKPSGDSDLFLMSECQYNIIANSSFSWWAAWMNAREDKKIIAPSMWTNNINERGVYCEDWILVTPEGSIVEKQEK